MLFTLSHFESDDPVPLSPLVVLGWMEFFLWCSPSLDVKHFLSNLFSCWCCPDKFSVDFIKGQVSPCQEIVPQYTVM